MSRHAAVGSLAALVLALCATGARSQVAAPDVPIVRVARVTSPIVVDGRLDEPAWTVATPATGLRQREPDEGAPATERSEIRVLFDDDAIYVGARLYDRQPAAIGRQRSRRDAVVDADRFTVYLDPNDDHLTGMEFSVTAAGVQRDVYVYNDVTEDDSWDAVWDSEVSIDDEGWTVEMRIPFSQLRFPRSDTPTWGFNVSRILLRRHEVSWLSLVPRIQSSLASRMARLEGLQMLRAPRHLELRPYGTMKAEFITPAFDHDPFNDGSRLFGRVGADVKYGIASNWTLDATVNPDFGQVEVDPAVVNLTAFETFVDEKRPFFIEGSQTFANYGNSGASVTPAFFRPNPIIFYSRRIGRAPQGFVTGDAVDKPLATTILGAAKVTGRTRRGWTVSAVDALTASESADLVLGVRRLTATVEPFTNYFAGRAFKELGARGGIGFIGTATDRHITTPALAGTLVSDAWIGGIDGHWFIDGRHEWVVHGSLAGSHLRGDAAAVTAVQKSSARYFQRPDAPHVHLDPTATSLSGWMGDMSVNRNSGNILVNGRLWGNSPGFEVNDLGFVTQTDRAGGHGLVTFRRLSPDRVFRTRQLAVGKWWTWNYGGEPQGDGEQVATTLQLLNYSQLNVTAGNSRNTLDDKLTRGGPTVIRPGIRNLSVSVLSDTRRKLGGQVTGAWSERNFGSWSRAFTAAITYRPSPVVSLAVGPGLLDVRTVAQYLRTVDDPTASITYGRRYVFGDLRQTEVSIESRLNVVLAPHVSVQAYLQPLISVGTYPSIRELARPRTYEFPIYGQQIGTIVPGPAHTFVIDPDGPGLAPPFVLPNPDFNFKSFRVNTILRWEWRPGSTLYFVWTENRRNTANPGDFAFGRDFADLLSAPPDDVVLVKATWWIGR